LTRTSPPEFRLVLSPKAQQDVENILRYTGEQWGEKQIPIYRDKLAGALKTLRGSPGFPEAAGHCCAATQTGERLAAASCGSIGYPLPPIEPTEKARA
jgi:plasmid stabilization system protein ParE